MENIQVLNDGADEEDFKWIDAIIYERDNHIYERSNRLYRQV